MPRIVKSSGLDVSLQGAVERGEEGSRRDCEPLSRARLSAHSRSGEGEPGLASWRRMNPVFRVAAKSSKDHRIKNNYFAFMKSDSGIITD